MLDNSEFISFLKAVFYFIELVMYKPICNSLIRDCPSNDQKCDNKDNLLSWNYTTLMKMTVKKC